MTRETDAAIFVRRETWRKALAAVTGPDVQWAIGSDAQVAMVIRMAIESAAHADGVILDDDSHEPSP